MAVKRSVSSLLFIIVLLITTAQLSLAQPEGETVFDPAIAYIDTAGNLLMKSRSAEDSATIAENTNPTELYPLFQYSLFTFSPDGSALVYRDGQTRNLMIRRSGQESANILVESNASGFPITFDPTSTIIYYVGYETTPTDSEFYEDYTVYGITIDGNDQTPLATFTYEVGCGGGTPDPADIVYTVANNAGFLGNSQSFARVDAGFVYTMRCDGIGVGLVTTNGDSHVIDGQLRRVNLSPDGTQLAGIRDGKMIVYNLEDESILAEVETSVDQLNWLDNDTIVFSTLESCSPINVSAEQAEALELPALAFESRLCELTLNTLNLVDLTETEIFSGNGYGIGGIESASENALIFTLIDSQYLMTDAENTTAIYYLEIGGDGAELLASGVKAIPSSGPFMIP